MTYSKTFLLLRMLKNSNHMNADSRKNVILMKTENNPSKSQTITCQRSHLVTMVKINLPKTSSISQQMVFQRDTMIRDQSMSMKIRNKGAKRVLKLVIC